MSTTARRLDARLTETSYALEVFRWQNLLYTVMIAGVLLGSRFIYILPFRLRGSSFSLRDQLVSRDNKAVSISFGCFTFAVALILFGSMTDLRPAASKQGQNVYETAAWCAIGLVFLMVARFINDRAILPGVVNTDALTEEHNVAAACVEGGSFISAGQIAMASISGPLNSWGTDIAGSTLFFVFGQIAFCLFALVYHKIVGYDLQEEIRQRNAAAGVAYGLRLIAVGVLVANPLLKSDSIITFWVFFVAGGVCVLLLRLVIDRFVLPKDKLDSEIADDHNWGAALIEGGASVALAYVISATLPYRCLENVMLNITAD
jgi:uncharacterized membrane protein YjfL (UPF0719 family)